LKRGKNLPLLLICSNKAADTSDEVTFAESLVKLRVSFLSAAQNKFVPKNDERMIKVKL
jgi:hypothetical protein